MKLTAILHVSDFDMNDMNWMPRADQIIIPGFFFPPSPKVPKEQQDVMDAGDERWIGGTVVVYFYPILGAKAAQNRVKI